MNFGTGEKVYEKDEGVLLDSELLPAAVKCWFTVQGRGMPLSMKYEMKKGRSRLWNLFLQIPFRNSGMEAFLFGDISAGSFRRG